MRRLGALTTVWIVVAATVAVEFPAMAASPPTLVIRDQATQPVFSLAEAIRETVFVDAPMDTDRDGRRDRIAVDIMRPGETADGLRVATIMQASPYYGRQSAPQAPDARMLEPTAPDVSFPSSYAEYFIPRGYAVVAVAMQGTGGSEGCPTTGGRADTISAKAVVDWLNGRATASYVDGRSATAMWSTGSVGMIGLSYDGTLANAVAAEGTSGLETIVPIAAISSWYDYARDQGAGRGSGWRDRYPEHQARRVASPESLQRCDALLAELGNSAGDDTYDYTPFWQERDYRGKAARVRASVLMVQGRQDEKVLGRQFAAWWEALARHDVPRKLWLHEGGHVHPNRIRPDEWQRVLHRWMDHWLYGIENGIMDEPMVDIQRPDGSWETHTNWPGNAARETRLWLGPADATAAGTLRSQPAAPGVVQTFSDDAGQFEEAMIADPTTVRPHRLAYLTPPLEHPLRVAGTPRLSITAAADQPSTPLTALLVDYGPVTEPTPRLDKPPPTVLPVVSRGAIDTKNRDSVRVGRPLQPGRQYHFEWELQGLDYVFAAGHRIGLVLVANNAAYIATDPAGAAVTVQLSRSNLTLPIVG